MTPDNEDEEFDRALGALLKRPQDEDVAVLSRNVLSAVGQAQRTQPAGAARELVWEPLPWAAGFSGLMLIAGAAGYALVPQVIGTDLWLWAALPDLVAIIGGF